MCDARRAWKQAKKDVDTFSEQPAFTRYPSGVRPFKVGSENEELDNVWSRTKEGPYELKLVFEKDTAKKTAMRMMHHSAARTIREIDLESLQYHLEATKVAAGKPAYNSAFKKIIEDAANPSMAAELGLAAPITGTFNKVWLEETMGNQYAQAWLEVVPKRGLRAHLC